MDLASKPHEHTKRLHVFSSTTEESHRATRRMFLAHCSRLISTLRRLIPAQPLHRVPATAAYKRQRLYWHQIWFSDESASLQEGVYQTRLQTGKSLCLASR